MDYSQNFMQEPLRFDLESLTTRLLARVYLWMSFALLISGGTAFFVASRTGVLSVFQQQPSLYVITCCLEVALVLLLTFYLHRMSLFLATCLFIVYAVFNGFTLSVIFLTYSLPSLVRGFVATAGIFMLMSLLGYFTKLDLTRYSKLLYVSLGGLIAISVVNFLLGSELLDFVVCSVGFVLFLALTAYDTKMIKLMLAESYGSGEETLGKVALLGAINIYLDFVNLFLYVMRLFFRR